MEQRPQGECNLNCVKLFFIFDYWIETKTSSAGEQLARDLSNRQNDFKSVAVKDKLLTSLFF